VSDPSLVNVGDLRTDADDLLSFCLEQLPGFTREHFEKYFRGNPSGAPLFVVGRDADGNLTGTASLHPVPFAVAGEVTDGAVAGDFVVRDDLRGFGPALGLQRALLDAAAERGWSLAIGFPNAAARAVLRRVGYRDLAACLRFTRPIGRREHVTSLLPRRSSSRVESAPSFDDLERRLRARATDSAGEIEVRLAIAHEQLRERDHFDIAIINDDAERATAELQQRLDALLDADSVKGSE